MSNCIKDLFDYDLVKKCRVCKNISLKSYFNKKTKSKDGLQSQCQFCVNDYDKNYFVDNKDRLLNKQKLYNKENRNQINTRMNECFKNRIKTDVNFRLIRNTRRRIHQALKGKSKSSSTGEILGIDIDLYRNWIEWQFTPEMNWSNTEVDHIWPICMFDVPKEEELKESFNWKNTQPLLKYDHQQKGTKFNFLDYQDEFIKAYQFIKLNEEGFNDNIH